MRLVFIRLVDRSLKSFPLVRPTLFVDDLSAEASGDSDEAVADSLAGFTQMVIDQIGAKLSSSSDERM